MITCKQFVQLYSTDIFLTQHWSFVLFLVFLQYTDNLPFKRMAKEILQAAKCVIVCCCLCCVPHFFSRSEKSDTDCVDCCTTKQTRVIFRKHASGKSCLIKMIIFSSCIQFIQQSLTQQYLFSFYALFLHSLSLSLSLETSNGIWLEEYGRD